MEPVRIVFMGTPQPAVGVLDKAVEIAGENGWSILAAYTAPDRPAGRGRRLSPSPVRERAEALGIPVLTPQRLTLPEEQERFRSLDPTSWSSRLRPALTPPFPSNRATAR